MSGDCDMFPCRLHAPCIELLWPYLLQLWDRIGVSSVGRVTRWVTVLDIEFDSWLDLLVPVMVCRSSLAPRDVGGYFAELRRLPNEPWPPLRSSGS